MEESIVRQWIDKLADASGQDIASVYANEIALTMRQYGEGAVVGGVLGAMDAALKDGLDYHGAPLDLGLSALSGVGAIFFAKDEFSHEFRNAGSHSLGIFTYRKTKELLSAKKTTTAGLEDDAHDETDVGEEDPIVAAAREL